MSKHKDADLILKLYELRRDPLMRDARNWFFEFNPMSAQEIVSVITSKDSTFYRMVISYWDMAASLVNHGAIDEDMFNDANGEQVAVFAKVSPYLKELRATYGNPNYLKNLEKLVMRMPDAEARLARTRERLMQMAAARQEQK